MLLTSDLAQKIVASIMSITHENINIMDSQGVIIASGQPHRLNTFHQGAKEAIDRDETVIIHGSDLDRYPGSRPGLNMPITLNGQIIGVVGISGEPQVVRNTAKMVKMVTELILEREMLREEFRSQAQLKEHFALLLFSEQVAEHYEKLAKTAKLLQYDLTLPRFILAADIPVIGEPDFQHFGFNGLASLRAQEHLLQRLNESPLVTEEDLLVFLENKLIILKHVATVITEAEQLQWARGVYQLLRNDDVGEALHIGLSGITEHYTELNPAYQEALSALANCRTDSPITAIYDVDVLAAYLVSKIRDAHFSKALDYTKAKIGGDFSRKYDIKATIVCLLDNNMSLAQTAKALYIHRNTLLFRLEKLKEATGLEPCHNINHALLCKILFGG